MRAIDEAVRKLIRTEHFRAASMISMPLLYPSGASVVLEVSGSDRKFFVSDKSGGFLEAEMMGADRIYGREAHRIASQYGIKFDGRNMFIAETSIDFLPAVLKMVGHCSQLAANIAASRLLQEDA